MTEDLECRWKGGRQMAWNGIKEWFANMIVSADDFNRIEGNTLDNHERLNGHDSRISSNTNRLNNIEDGPLTKILGRQVGWVEYTLSDVLSSFASPGTSP